MSCPIADTCPGEPPSLVHRVDFSDKDLAFSWRQNRTIVKGRFLGGNLGYVFSDELELFANAFRRPLERLSHKQEKVLEAVVHAGPLTPRQIKEETGMLNKEIMPVLHRLQQAFLVYEDQVDSDWERSWYGFSQEWPDVVIRSERWEKAAQKVLSRFIYAQVFVADEQVKDWSGWTVRQIRRLIQLMEDGGDIVRCNVAGLGEGWIEKEDSELKSSAPEQSVFMLHKGDPMVCAHKSELKRRFAGLEVLQYLLIDGEFKGAVCGHWRIGPHDVEDIVVNLPLKESKKRKAEIIRAVAWIYKPPIHNILRYTGKDVRD